MRVQWFLVAFAGTFAASFDFVAKLGVPIYPFGYLPVLWWLLLVGYAIQRNRILDITPSLAACHIIDTMADAVLVIDEEGIIRIANHAAADMFRTAEPLTGRPLSSVDGGLWPKIELARWAPERTIRQVEIATYSGSSCPATVEVSASVISSSRSDEPIATVCVFRDVSDRRRVELELRRCQAPLDHTRSLVYFTDAEHRFVLVNRHFEQVLNVRSGEVLGKSLHEIFGVHADELVRHHERAIEAEVPFECEEAIAYGEERHVYFSIKVPLFYLAGSPYGVCNISTEVTGKRRTEDDRQRVVSQLQ